MIVLEKASFAEGRSLMGWTCDDNGIRRLIVSTEITKFYSENGSLRAVSTNGTEFEVKSFDEQTMQELEAIKTSKMKKNEAKMAKFLQKLTNKLPDTQIAIEGWFSELEALLTLENGTEIYSKQIVSYTSVDRILTINYEKKEMKIFLSQGVWVF